MLDFAVKVTEASARSTEADIEQPCAARLHDEDVMDIAEVAAMFNLTNRMANALHSTERGVPQRGSVRPRGGGPDEDPAPTSYGRIV